MDTNNARYQNSIRVAEQMVPLRRGVDYFLEFVSCERANGFKERQKSSGKISIARVEAT